LAAAPLPLPELSPLPESSSPLGILAEQAASVAATAQGATNPTDLRAREERFIVDDDQVSEDSLHQATHRPREAQPQRFVRTCGQGPAALRKNLQRLFNARAGSAPYDARVMTVFAGFADAEGKLFKLLAKNNRRDWFLAHKEEFETGWNTPMKALLEDLREVIDASYPHTDSS
jgi:hypothetical protein